MNVLLMSLLYPNDRIQLIQQNVKDKVQNQINSYQRAFEEGIRQNLAPDETLALCNALPVGIFPLQYRKLLIPSGWHDGHTLYELGCINLPWFKQQGRKRRAYRALLRWVKQSPSNRTAVLYTMYLPYLQAVLRVKKRFPDLKACVIVTDLPNELGLPSGRKGLLKRIEYARGRKSLSLCRAMDGFVLLTSPMAQALKVENKPCLVIEGLIQKDAGEAHSMPTEPVTNSTRPAVLYSGTLERDLGIGELLEAFAQMPEYELWVCGQGGMQREVEQAAKQFSNIRFFGFVPREKALQLQSCAALLINPRSPKGVFTRYSFPSKTLEYMRSGKPVVCYQLKGIPQDYDPYLCYIQGEGAHAIAQAVRAVLQKSPEERTAMGQRAQSYVLSAKTPQVQCKRLVAFLRGLMTCS